MPEMGRKIKYIFLIIHYNITNCDYEKPKSNIFLNSGRLKFPYQDWKNGKNFLLPLVSNIIVEILASAIRIYT